MLRVCSFISCLFIGVLLRFPPNPQGYLFVSGPLSKSIDRSLQAVWSCGALK